MQVICAGCSSRYKLADSKIKQTGTKVRCPKCSKTFVVFPGSSDSPQNPKTSASSPVPRKLDSNAQTTVSAKKRRERVAAEEAKAEEKARIEAEEAAAKEDARIKAEEAKEREKARKEAEEAAAKEDARIKAEEAKAAKKVKADAEAEASSTPEEFEAFNSKTLVSDKNIFAQENLDSFIRSKVSSEEEIVHNQETAASAKSDDDTSDVLDEATQALPADASPFKGFRDPAKQSPSKIEDPGEPSESSEKFRPFGDATLMEIQGLNKRRSAFKRYLLPLILIAGVSYGLYYVTTNFSFQRTSTTFKVHQIHRPAGWYQHDPASYQSVLTQVAALPRAEQEAPENRALLAETLILNGLLTGDNDQVLSGMGIVSNLSVAYPNSPLSFYGSAVFALSQNDRRSMQDLYDRWPESHRDDAEFELLAIVHFARSGQIERSLQRAGQLFKARPDFVRARLYTLLLSLQNPETAQAVFSPTDLDSLKNEYRTHKGQIQNHVRQLPRIYQDIDRLMGESNNRQRPTQAARRSPPAAPERSAPPPEPEPEPQAAAPAQVPTSPKPPVPNPAAERGPQTSPSGLPRASPELVAHARSAREAEQEAGRLFQAGNRSFQQGNLDDALRSYRDALKADPEHADVYKQIGQIYMQREEAGRALRSFKIYLQLKPNSSDRQEVEKWISSLE